MVNCCITVQERYLKTLATDERLPLVAYHVAAKERESHISPYFQIEHSVGRHSGAEHVSGAGSERKTEPSAPKIE